MREQVSIRERLKQQAQIKRWMLAHLKEFLDSCNEVNCTAMVESWDRACSSGDSTMNPEHPAWEIAGAIARNTKESPRCVCPF